MDNDKIAIIGSSMDALASLIHLKLKELSDAGQLPTIIADTKPPTLETFVFKRVETPPMPFSRKEKSHYKCDGTFKRGRRR